MQCATKLALDAELDIGVKSVTNHACAGSIKLELALYSIHHCLARLAERQRLLSRSVNNGDVTGASAEEEVVVHWQCRIDVGSEECSSALDVVHSMGVLEVVDMVVKATENNSHLGVEQ